MEKNPEKQTVKSNIDRRDFLQKSLLLAGGTVGASWLLSACGKSSTSAAASGPSVNFTIDLSSTQYKSLKTKGSYVYVNTTIVACDASGNYVALYSVCPHAGCDIIFDGSSQFPCPCHGSIFDESGNVVQGPASSGVRKYTCTLNGNILTVAG